MAGTRARAGLKALEGGAGGATILDAVTRYAEERGLPDGEEERIGIEVALELITRFFDVADPPRSTRDGPPAAARLRAERIVPALGPCVRLFPYANIVRSEWIPLFGREAHALARWCHAQRLCDGRALARFERALEAARPSLERFHRLQRAIERFPAPPVLSGDGEELTEGRFRIVGRDGGEVALVVPGKTLLGPVRLPEAARPLFRGGLDVSMILSPGRAGWWPIASTLPVTPARAERLVAVAGRALAPPAHLARAD